MLLCTFVLLTIYMNPCICVYLQKMNWTKMAASRLCLLKKATRFLFSSSAVRDRPSVSTGDMDRPSATDPTSIRSAPVCVLPHSTALVASFLLSRLKLSRVNSPSVETWLISDGIMLSMFVLHVSLFNLVFYFIASMN